MLLCPINRLQILVLGWQTLTFISVSFLLGDSLVFSPGCAPESLVEYFFPQNTDAGACPLNILIEQMQALGSLQTPPQATLTCSPVDNLRFKRCCLAAFLRHSPYSHALPQIFIPTDKLSILFLIALALKWVFPLSKKAQSLFKMVSYPAFIQLPIHPLLNCGTLKLPF